MDGLAMKYARIPEINKKKPPLRIQKTKSPQPIKSPADRILFLQRTIGNQAVQRLIKSGTLQAKLKIGQPGDKYEQEADRVADAVMRMPEPGVQRQVEPEEEEEESLQAKPIANQITPLVQVQRQEEPEEEEEGETIQTKPLTGQNFEVAPGVENNINANRGSGQPLSANERSFFEPRFGRDFSQVRVHTDVPAAESAGAVNARAFTMGQDIMFGAGQYASRTDSGQKLLAHELTHVVQQSQIDESIPGHIHFLQTPSTLTIQKEGSTPQLIQLSPIIPGVHPCERVRYQLLQVRRELHRVETQICNNQRSMSEAQNCEPQIEQWEDCRARGAQECQPPSRCLTIGNVETYRRRLGELILRRNNLQQREQRLLEQIHRECGYDVPTRSPVTC
jgi:Domain of unknown function (DUF4157)